LQLKESENELRLIEVKNQQLEKDIESKNRELAISTMSLIKKNEFLNQLQSEINKYKEEPKKGIVQIGKIINRKLNQNSDWEFFEKAFNNADQDFFKKIKEIHPNLTPNDLKLCAYLRLNLSSKEIAPLFNISTKSVEVKRYRLRKKMDLDRDVSLTNYILEL
ncbi:MAG: LuxR C-terminal-related transcriptional regulator, partial [Psychroflexus maritimus]